MTFQCGVWDRTLLNCPHPRKGLVSFNLRFDRAQRRHCRIKGSLGPTVTGFPDLAKDFQGGKLSILFKDVAYYFPEALNDAWPADSTLPSLGGVNEMFNSYLPRDAPDRTERDSRQAGNLGSL
jgi:hypothetical protein